MILWTILLEPAYEILQAQGRLTYRDRWIEEDRDFKDWVRPFSWMAKNLAERAGEAPEGVKYPLWAWHQWNGVKQPRPDLRHNSFVAKGVTGYRVEFEINPEDVIISDFSTWHCVLNNFYLPWDEKDADDFEGRLEKLGLSRFGTEKLPDNFRKEVEESWLRVFDLSHSDDYVTYPMEKKITQACFWELRRNQVRKVDRFVGR